MFDVFKYLSDLTARAHFLEGTINKKTGKLFTKEEIAETLGLIDCEGNLVLHKKETVSEPVTENYISESDDENKEDE